MRNGTRAGIEDAVASLGSGPLAEAGIATRLRPLFTRTLSAKSTYLATQSLGRPLDAVKEDLQEGLSLWEQALTGAWTPWLAEETEYRAQLAALIGAEEGAPGCVVPRVSAGPALRTVLNMLPDGARVLSTSGEFTSVAMLLAQYASVARIALVLVGPSSGQYGDQFEISALCEAVCAQAARGEAVSLVVVSHVYYATGQLLLGVDELARVCHEAGARLLVDSYHSLGAVPVDVKALGCDYLIGGCYKYLRGGPGAAFLYLSPGVLASGLRPLDTGWFALESEWQTDDGPRLRQGGDALLEGTPAVLTYYQARSGMRFTRAMGVERLRDYSLKQLRRLKGLLMAHGIESGGGDAQHGAFLTLRHPQAQRIAALMVEREFVVNAREGRLRICPDCLTRDDELVSVADALAKVWQSVG